MSEEENNEVEEKDTASNEKHKKEIIIARTKDILEWIYCIIIAVVLAVLIKYYVGTPTVVRMSSMYPTLEQDDRLILSRINKTLKKLPERGDIITFEQPSDIGIRVWKNKLYKKSNRTSRRTCRT